MKHTVDEHSPGIPYTLAKAAMAFMNEDLHGNAPDKAGVALLLIDVINDLEFPDGDELLRHAVPMAQKLSILSAAPGSREYALSTSMTISAAGSRISRRRLSIVSTTACSNRWPGFSRPTSGHRCSLTSSGFTAAIAIDKQHGRGWRRSRSEPRVGADRAHSSAGQPEQHRPRGRRSCAAGNPFGTIAKIV